MDFKREENNFPISTLKANALEFTRLSTFEVSFSFRWIGYTYLRETKLNYNLQKKTTINKNKIESTRK